MALDLGDPARVADHGGYVENPFVADIYDHIESYRQRSDITFLVESARESAGPVLEIGSGTGRVLIPTARAGIEILGLDSSLHMIRACKRLLRKESASVQLRVGLIHADMRRFALRRAFGLITVPFRLFQHLPTAREQRSCLAEIHSHLQAGGKVILDLDNPAHERSPFPIGLEFGTEPEFHTSDGRQVVRRRKIVERDPINRIEAVELIYYVTHLDGRSERFVHAYSMRYLSLAEAESMLRSCGLHIERVYSDYARCPYDTSSPSRDLIIVATR